VAYLLLAAPSAQRELDALPPAIANGLRLILRALADEPRSSRFDLKKLAGNDERPPPLRLRVADYRVVLQIDHAVKEIHIVAVGHRSKVYRRWGGGD
jgi:mRNA interferase RelE/StbE